MNFLGKNLRYLRKQSSKTQSDIASLIQKGQTTVGNWENGISEPSLNELLIISNYFDISLDTLLKTDLSGQNGHIAVNGQHTGHKNPYDHTHPPLPETGERDGELSFVLQEIKNIRSEMEKLYARLPAKP